MREDYEITIIGRQTIDAQTDEIQVDTLGDYTERGGAKYISYTEYADEAPYNGQLKVLKIENEDTVTMLTPGTPTRLVLEKGKRHKCLYDTGAGVLSLGVYTQTLKHDLSAAGGELCIRYTLDIDTHAFLQQRNTAFACASVIYSINKPKGTIPYCLKQ